MRTEAICPTFPGIIPFTPDVLVSYPLNSPSTLKCPGWDNKLDGHSTYELLRLGLLETNLNVEKQMPTILQREVGKGA